MNEVEQKILKQAPDPPEIIPQEEIDRVAKFMLATIRLNTSRLPHPSVLYTWFAVPELPLWTKKNMKCGIPAIIQALIRLRLIHKDRMILSLPEAEEIVKNEGLTLKLAEELGSWIVL